MSIRSDVDLARRGCDVCNNYFASKVEGTLLETQPRRALFKSINELSWSKYHDQRKQKCRRNEQASARAIG
jgi:hypothetical protein